MARKRRAKQKHGLLYSIFVILAVLLLIWIVMSGLVLAWKILFGLLPILLVVALVYMLLKNH